MIKNLRLLFQDFGDFVRHDFNLKSYLYTLVVIACSITVIYGTSWGERFSKGLVPTSNSLINILLCYGVMYYLAAIPILAIRREYAALTNPKFYLKSFAFIFMLSFSEYVVWSKVLDLSSYAAMERSFIFKVLARGRNLIFVLPALIFIRIFFDKKVKGLYGLCGGNHHVRAYLSLYVVVIPLLVLASFTPDFLSYYPNFKPWFYQDVFGLPTWFNTVAFEVVYMADFIMVEMFFRGALVIGMAALLGRSAVLPMVAVYVALHFGKPALETMSAMFGGYFLGALAFQTRHIWGGVIIHMGIALMIELVRFFEHYVLGVG
jgi:hypothetical protein